MFSTREMLYLALGLIVIGFLGFVWNVLNMQGVKNRGRQRQSSSGRRETDVKPMSRNDRRLVKQAERLLREGNVQTGAQILESVGLMREAINALESAGLINEAAKVLMRMQRPGRAGVVYARHNMWDKAMSCFKTAEMPLEAAKCARELGDYATAGAFFEQAGRLETAAESYEAGGDLLRAGRLFMRHTATERAMAAFAKLAGATRSVATLEFTEDEVVGMVQYVGSGQMLLPLVDVLVHRNKLVDVIKLMVAKGFTKEAAEILPRSSVDVGPQLMADVNYQDQSAGNMAEMFTMASAYVYGGMIYEHMNAFDRAGDCFERAGDRERAIYCYERAGCMDKVKLLQSRPVIPPPPSRISLTTMEDERTAVVGAAPVAAASAKVAVPSKMSLALADDEGDDMTRVAATVTPPAAAADGDRIAFEALSMCAELSPDQRQTFWGMGSVETYAAGSTIFGDGKGVPSLFVLLSGSGVVVHEGTEGGSSVKAGSVLGAGWFIGSMAVPKRILAETDSRLYQVPKESLEGAMERDGVLARRLYKELTRQLRN